MSDFKVIDKTGDWMFNKSPYRMVDGLNGNIFESGVPTKVVLNDWLITQGDTIVPCADPMESGESLPEIITGNEREVNIVKPTPAQAPRKGSK